MFVSNIHWRRDHRSRLFLRKFLAEMAHKNSQNVQLTKVYYYDQNNRHRNMEIFTLTRENFDNKINKDKIIKKNIFGHKWILKINESESIKSRTSTRFVLYLIVTFSLVVAVVFGVVFSIDAKYFKIFHQVPKYFNNKTIYIKNDTDLFASVDDVRKEIIFSTKETVTQNSLKILCDSCNQDEVCLNTSQVPKCVKMINKKDPTGCGGLCKINAEYCKVLDSKIRLFQCLPDRAGLQCPLDTHNCGNMCISKDHLCDGYFHCSDKSDEYNCECDLDNNFQCGNFTSCLSKNKLCDGSIDCWDAYDEKHCYSEECSSVEFSCRSGECIPFDMACDGKYDCNERDDESIGCLKKFLKKN